MNIVMWFLIKGAFWFTTVLLVLPFFEPADPDGGSDGRPAFEPAAMLETVGAARQAIEDIGGLCGRRPQVCETGGETLEALQSRAREGARIAYDFLDGRLGGSAVQTGSVPASAAAGRQEPDAHAAPLTYGPIATDGRSAGASAAAPSFDEAASDLIRPAPFPPLTPGAVPAPAMRPDTG